jgi:hypothetical protein
VENSERVKMGTYAVTLTAADYIRILTSLGAMRDEYTSLGLAGLAEDAERTRANVEAQVMQR